MLTDPSRVWEGRKWEARRAEEKRRRACLWCAWSCMFQTWDKGYMETCKCMFSFIPEDYSVAGWRLGQSLRLQGSRLDHYTAQVDTYEGKCGVEAAQEKLLSLFYVRTRWLLPQHRNNSQESNTEPRLWAWSLTARTIKTNNNWKQPGTCTQTAHARVVSHTHREWTTTQHTLTKIQLLFLSHNFKPIITLNVVFYNKLIIQ